MNTIYYDDGFDDDERRGLLYEGQVFVYSPTATTLEFIDFSRNLIEGAFGDLDPETAQDDLPVGKYVEILKELKPKFIHHPESKRFLRAILEEHGCDRNATYFDVPRMRTSTSDGYLTSGIAYAFHPHRDTWYSAPMCQINWWIPIYPVKSGNVMAFHPAYFGAPVINGSKEYNYQEWQATSRKDAAKHIETDTRKQPRPEESIDLDPQVRIVTPPGGMVVFAASQLHSSVPNSTGKTRFSIDFRTVNDGDLLNEKGSKNVDSACSGTAMNDYLRIADLEHLPVEIVDRYMPGHPQRPLVS